MRTPNIKPSVALLLYGHSTLAFAVYFMNLHQNDSIALHLARGQANVLQVLWLIFMESFYILFPPAFCLRLNVRNN